MTAKGRDRTPALRHYRHRQRAGRPWDHDSREELATLYATAVEQQAVQGQGDTPRALACRCIRDFLSLPLAGDRSRIRLIVDNTPG